MNIVSANHVIHLDRWWNPAVEDQCTDRVYRIGALKEVYIYTLGAVHPILKENSYDIILDKLLSSRRSTSKQIFSVSELQPSDFLNAILKQKNIYSIDELLSEIDNRDYLNFEEFVYNELLNLPLKVSKTLKSNDGGADIILRDFTGDIKFFVQCKHTINIDIPIDAGLCADLVRVRQNWKSPYATVIGITNAHKVTNRVLSEYQSNNGFIISRADIHRICSLPIFQSAFKT